MELRDKVIRLFEEWFNSNLNQTKPDGRLSDTIQIRAFIDVFLTKDQHKY